jgi:hypothetical protein
MTAKRAFHKIIPSMNGELLLFKIYPKVFEIFKLIPWVI